MSSPYKSVTRTLTRPSMGGLATINEQTLETVEYDRGVRPPRCHTASGYEQLACCSLFALISYHRSEISHISTNHEHVWRIITWTSSEFEFLTPKLISVIIIPYIDLSTTKRTQVVFVQVIILASCYVTARSGWPTVLCTTNTTVGLSPQRW